MGSLAKVNEPFTGYNKTDPDGALVGNWVEERVLHRTTGRHRLGVRPYNTLIQSYLPELNSRWWCEGNKAAID